MDFYIENKIYYHDTDSGGVMYYGSYLEHLEEGRSGYCAYKGVDLLDLSRAGLIFPAVHLEIDYKNPARYGDVIRIFTDTDKIGNASISFIQEIRRGEISLAKAKTVWACVGIDMRPKRVPEDVKKALLSGRTESRP